MTGECRTAFIGGYGRDRLELAFLSASYNRFVQRRMLGVRDRIFEAVSCVYESALQMIDSSSIRIHQHSANGKREAQDLANGEERCNPRRGSLARRVGYRDARSGRSARVTDPAEADRETTHGARAPAAYSTIIDADQVLHAERA